MRFDGKRVLMTGGSGGIGVRLCERLHNAGADVTVIGRTQILHLPVETIYGDLSSPESLEAVTATVAEEPWDILINLAGVQHFGAFEHEPTHHLADTYMVNLIAPALLIQAIAPGMKARGGGCIANVGSVFGSINFAHFASYSSSKAGLHGLSQALRREYADHGIDVLYIAPRAVKTPFNSPKVLEYARLTKMHMDEPDRVAARIVTAIRRRTPEVYIGFPESLFVRINSVAPALIDNALAGNDRQAALLVQD